MLQAFIHWGHGTKGPFSTDQIDVKETEYKRKVFKGARRTEFMVMCWGRWYRVWQKEGDYITVNGKREKVQIRNYIT